MRFTSTIIAVLLLACACGSSGVSAPTQFLSAPNVPQMSGYLEGPAPATVFPSTIPALPYVGDGPAGRVEAAFYRFNIAAIPAGWIVEEATFRVGQEAYNGSPYASLGGQVLIDHVELGAALDPADWTPTVYAGNVAVLSTNNTLNQKSASIRSAVQADVNAGRTHTDIRLRFPVANNGDGFWDDVGFNNQADTGGSGLLPILEIRYRAP